MSHWLGWSRLLQKSDVWHGELNIICIRIGKGVLVLNRRRGGLDVFNEIVKFSNVVDLVQVVLKTELDRPNTHEAFSLASCV